MRTVVATLLPRDLSPPIMIGCFGTRAAVVGELAAFGVDVEAEDFSDLLLMFETRRGEAIKIDISGEKRLLWEPTRTRIRLQFTAAFQFDDANPRAVLGLINSTEV